jgi:ornithine cyclodeaminase/alanine dehydrogenase-like protein (mu-crystallin family)
MLSKVTNVALIGCGRVAVSHAKSLVALEHTNLAAVVDVKEDRAKKFSEEYGAPWFTDYEDVLRDPNIDAVEIATPHHLHAPIAIAAANAGESMRIEVGLDNISKGIHNLYLGHVKHPERIYWPDTDDLSDTAFMISPIATVLYDDAAHKTKEDFPHLHAKNRCLA